MSQTPSIQAVKQPFVVAISSRALFDLDDSHQIFQQQGLASYADYQVQHENELLSPGIAFPLVKKLLALNESNNGEKNTRHAGVEVILLSRNSADTGLRIFNTIEHYGLDIVRAAFTNGVSPHTYMQPFGAHLFLSSHGDDVRAALQAGHAAATLMPSAINEDTTTQLRIAFDGDIQ